MIDAEQRERAQRRVAEYSRRFSTYGDNALLLAYHAALPVALTPELLHLIRINFFLDPKDESANNWHPLPYWIEFDFLLSPLCQQVDEGLYEIEPAVRDLLLEKLVATYRDSERVREIATLLWQYIVNYAPWEDRIELERAQQLTALNFLAPEKALDWLEYAEVEEALGKGVEQEWYMVMRQGIEKQTQIINRQRTDDISSRKTYDNEKLTDKLIEIFAQCDIDDLERNQDYIKLFREYQGKVWFDHKRKIVTEIKRFLEESVEQQASSKNQIIEALKSLNMMNNQEEKNICYELIIKGYSNQWTENQLNHFKKYSDALQNYWSYFFSFTGRNPAPQQDNYINIKHRFLIEHILGRYFYKRADKKKQNLLAEAINYCLKIEGNNGGTGGFYYLDQPGDNRDVEEKIQEELEKCFVFIQLIQNIMFLPDQNPNYCYSQYRYAREFFPDTTNFIFLLAEESRDSLLAIRHEIPLEYYEWYSDILDRDLIILEPTENYNRKHIQNQIYKIRQNIVQKIDQIKWKMIEDVPD